MMSHRQQLLSLRLLVLLMAVGGVFLLLSGRVAASTPASEASYKVQPGDTLWAIAGSIAGPSNDVRSVIARIKQLNDLTESSLDRGQVLLLPAA